MRQRILFVGYPVSVLLFQLRVQDGDGAVYPDRMTLVIGGIVGERPEREGIFIDVLRIAQESQDEVSAANVMSQVADESTAVWVIAHVLDNGAPIGIGVGFF